MSRTAPSKTKIILIGIAVALAIGGGTWAYVANSPSHKTHAVVNEQHQTMQLSYRGHDGQNALDLLKKHAAVETKHYSFGDQVIAINSTTGNGPKYWTLYVNGKQSQVGAGVYVTKSSDDITWKLQ
jgi:hypothetical protein